MKNLSFRLSVTLAMSIWSFGPMAAETEQKPANKQIKGLTGWRFDAVTIPPSPSGGGADDCALCVQGALQFDVQRDSELPKEGGCRLKDGSPVATWTFKAPCAGKVEIILTSSAFDTYLLLVEASSCLVLDENDDCVSGDTSKSCLVLDLPASEFVVAVNSYDPAEGGAYQILVKSLTSSPQFHRGDIDASGTIDINDPVYLINYLFLGGPAPPCNNAADSDDNGALDLTDVIVNLAFQFLGGPPPPIPGPPPQTCGPEPSPDQSASDLGCVCYEKC